MRPHNLQLQLSGWQAAGLVDGQLRGNALGLQRQRSASETVADGKSTEATIGATYIPPFVRVERTLQLGLDWYVETVVQRVAPASGAINLQVPLLSGESLTSAGLQVKAGKVAVTLAPRQRSLRWRSTLSKTDLLTLQAASDPRWVESWTVISSPIWHVETVAIDGVEPLPPVKQQLGQQTGQWMPQWRPWPGEQLRLSFTRPVGLAGETLTIDGVALKHEACRWQASGRDQHDP